MKDRFKFRAKRYFLDKEWVYGSYVANGDDHRITVWNPFIENFESIKVDPKTVGQSTGRKDKNGKLIFEGDIVRADSRHNWKIVFRDDYHCDMVLEALKNATDYISRQTLFGSEDRLEIIGNIHQSPHLLNPKGASNA